MNFHIKVQKNTIELYRYITSLALSLQLNKSKNLKTIYFINSINYDNSLKNINLYREIK